MNKQRCKWLGLAVLSLTTLFVMGGCGGGSSSSTPAPVVTAKTTISGTVTFPSLSALVGKAAVAKQVAGAVPTSFTVELHKLDGTLVASKLITVNIYSFENIDVDDYVIKVVAGTGAQAQVLKALLDKNSIADTTVRNIDTVSTTAVIVAEQKMSAAIGSLGETGSTKTSADIAVIHPAVLESKIQSAVNNLKIAGAAATASADSIALVNLVNVVTATVYNSVNTTTFVAGTAPATVTVIAVQFTFGTAASASPTLAASVVAPTLTAAVASYTPPAVGTFAFMSKVGGSVTTPGVAGVSVTTTGLTPEISTVTDANGFYTLAGITGGTLFTVKMSKATYADTYSAQITLARNWDASTRPFGLIPAANLRTIYGGTAGTGLIVSSVVVSTDVVSGYMGGVVVTAKNKSTGASYPVGYFALTSNTVDSSLTSTNTNGRWMIKDIPDGAVVEVTASKSGYTFNTRTYLVKADSLSQGRLTGTLVPVTVTTPPATTSPIKTSLLSGWYELRSHSVYTPGTATIPGITTNYYTIDRYGLAADGVTMTRATTSYYDRASKAWTATMPAGYPTFTNTDLALNAAGVWVADNAPNGMTLVYNADGSATATNPADSSIITVQVGTVDLTGLPISSIDLHGAPLLATATAYPAGAAKYLLTITNVTDSYSLWSGNVPSTVTTLAAVPAAYPEGTTAGGFGIDGTATDYFFGRFASATSVNIYKGTNGSTAAPTIIGTAIAATTTVRGQQLLEITIPAAISTAYKLTINPIFAVANGVVMLGSHSVKGVVDSQKGGSLYNDVAVNYLKANLNTALLKPAVPKAVSSAFFGR